MALRTWDSLVNYLFLMNSSHLVLVKSLTVISVYHKLTYLNLFIADIFQLLMIKNLWAFWADDLLIRKLQQGTVFGVTIWWESVKLNNWWLDFRRVIVVLHNVFLFYDSICSWSTLAKQLFTPSRITKLQILHLEIFLLSHLLTNGQPCALV